MSSSSEGPVILAAFANDHSDAANYLRNLSVEAKRIQSVLEPAHELCPLVLLPSATLDEILDAFQKYRDRVVVFHYAGHANGFELLLESATGGVHRVGAQGLASFLGQQQGLQLVFLNGCSTERQAEDLLNAGVGCVIATTQSIDDAVATDFSARFYKGIVTGAPLQSAYTEATGSAQASSGGSISRLIRRKEEPVKPVEERWPWLLKFKPGAERVAQWSLPEAAGDPLFGLPPVKHRELPESPYRHLYRFEEQHAEVFFGRGHEIRELYQRVTASDAAPVVLFYGPSGVGKSSLLDAGLIPRLAGKNEVRYVRRDATLGLGETLRSVFPKEFQSLSRRDAWIATEKQLGRPLVIVLDQLEEVFTKPNNKQPNELAEFAQLLKRMFNAPNHRPLGRLVLGFRKEWFAEIDELLADAQVPRSRIFLDRLSRRGAIEAITGPIDDLRIASHYNLRVADGLPDIIADDLLADPDTPVAPTLQILLTRMWSEACRRNREQPLFDVELYQSLHRNGIMLDDFLKQQTEQIRSRLPRAVDSGFLLDLLEFHTTGIGTSAEHPLPVLEAMYAEQAKSGLLAQTLKLCEELYLLTFSGDGRKQKRPSTLTPSPSPGGRGEPEKESSSGDAVRNSRLLHDTLAPLIRARHEESDLPGQRARRILDNRMVDWLDGKVGIPLDAKDLKEVEAALEGTRSWSPDEQRLVTASREQRSSNRRWSRIFKGLGLAAVVGIAVAGGVAYYNNVIATNAKAEAAKQLAIAEAAKAEADAAVLLANQKIEEVKTLTTEATRLGQLATKAQDAATIANAEAAEKKKAAEAAELKASAALVEAEKQTALAKSAGEEVIKATMDVETQKKLAATAKEAADKATKAFMEADRMAKAAEAEAKKQTTIAKEAQSAAQIAQLAADLATDLAKKKTKEADLQAARARFELARSERRMGVTSRDIDQEFLISAHHFAASAASSDSPLIADAMRFAASRSIAGVRLVSTLKSGGSVHKAWMLDDGSVCAWFTNDVQPRAQGFRRWNPDGESVQNTNLSLGFSDVLLPPKGDRLILIKRGWQDDQGPADNGKLVVRDISQNKIEGGGIEAMAGASYRSDDEQRVVYWSQAGVFSLDLENQKADMIPALGVSGARVSASGQKALTWKFSSPPTDGTPAPAPEMLKLWSRQPDGAWNHVEVPVTPVDNLQPDFIADSDQFLVWLARTFEEAAPSSGPPKESLVGHYYDGSGRLQTTLIPGSPVEYHKWGARGWGHAPTKSPAGLTVCLWDQREERACSWWLPEAGQTSPTAAEAILGVDHWSNDAVYGAAIAPDGRQIAFWSGRDIDLVGTGNSEPDTARITMKLSHSERVQHASFSAEGKKLLAWTARERQAADMQVGSAGNPPGPVRVWETATGVPLTVPIKLSTPLRGAKFVDQDQGILVWSEGGVIQHWQLTGTPTLPCEISPMEHDQLHSKSADGSRFVELKDQSIRILDDQHQPVESIPSDPGLRGLQFVGPGRTVLEWGSTNRGTGGYACLWNADIPVRGRLLRHSLSVSRAESSSDQSMILTSTSAGPLTNTDHATAHLWDATTAIELMEPLKIYGSKMCCAHFQAGLAGIVVETEFGSPALAYAYDISPDRRIELSPDPRIEIVLRTGSYLNGDGELIFLPREAWEKLKRQSPMPTYDSWIETAHSSP